MLERRAPLLELRLLGGRHRAHVGIGRRIRDERIETFELGYDVAVIFHGLDHGVEFGEFPRELDVGLGRDLGRKLAFNRLVAGDQRVEFLLGKHGHVDCKRRLCVRDAKLKQAARVKAGALPRPQMP